MPNYNEFMMRHSEFGAQLIIEQIERIEGVCAEAGQSLEDRWDALMSSDAPQQRLAA